MEFQVITDKRLPTIRAGRAAITFHYRKDMAAVSAGIEDRKTDTGRMKMSSVELTVLDLVRYPHAAGGLDNIATVIGDLAERIAAVKLATLSAAFERSVIQRLGYLLDRFAHPELAEALHAVLPKDSALPWTELERPQVAIDGLPLAPIERNARWHIIARRVPERDE
jgi:hypothetical protein